MYTMYTRIIQMHAIPCSFLQSPCRIPLGFSAYAKWELRPLQSGSPRASTIRILQKDAVVRYVRYRSSPLRARGRVSGYFCVLRFRFSTVTHFAFAHFIWCLYTFIYLVYTPTYVWCIRLQFTITELNFGRKFVNSSSCSWACT